MSREQSQATRLVALAQKADFFMAEHDPEQVFAMIRRHEHSEVLPVRGKAFRRWLGQLYYSQELAAANSEAIASALNTLEGQAIAQGLVHRVSVRVGMVDNQVILDLCDREWNVVLISTRGWQVVPMAQAGVRFVRYPGMSALPRPLEGGQLGPLRGLLNLRDDAQSVLLTAALFGYLHPTGPYPVLIFTGEPGSGKSTGTRVARTIIDPNRSPLRSPPKNIEDVMVGAVRNWVLPFDNLSHIPDWLSDALCRLATGSGLAKRQLYTDADEIVLDASRPVLLTSVEEVATASDLLDRALLLELMSIPEGQREREEMFWARFREAWPAILGGLCTAVSTALRRGPKIRLTELPRMADFCHWVVAASPALGFTPEEFLDAYRQNHQRLHETAMEADPVAALVLTLVGEGEFHGTPTQLLEKLTMMASESQRRARAWPKDATRLSGRLKRLNPALRERGIEVLWTHEGRGPEKHRIVSVGRIR